MDGGGEGIRRVDASTPGPETACRGPAGGCSRGMLCVIFRSSRHCSLYSTNVMGKSEREQQIAARRSLTTREELRN